MDPTTSIPIHLTTETVVLAAAGLVLAWSALRRDVARLGVRACARRRPEPPCGPVHRERGRSVAPRAPARRHHRARRQRPADRHRTRRFSRQVSQRSPAVPSGMRSRAERPRTSPIGPHLLRVVAGGRDPRLGLASDAPVRAIACARGVHRPCSRSPSSSPEVRSLASPRSTAGTISTRGWPPTQRPSVATSSTSRDALRRRAVDLLAVPLVAGREPDGGDRPTAAAAGRVGRRRRRRRGVTRVCRIARARRCRGSHGTWRRSTPTPTARKAKPTSLISASEQGLLAVATAPDLPSRRHVDARRT